MAKRLGTAGVDCLEVTLWFGSTITAQHIL